MNDKVFVRQLTVLVGGVFWMLAVVLVPPCESKISFDGWSSGRGLLWNPPVSGSAGEEDDPFRHVDTKQLLVEMAAIACLCGIVIVGVGFVSISAESPVVDGPQPRSSQWS